MNVVERVDAGLDRVRGWGEQAVWQIETSLGLVWWVVTAALLWVWLGVVYSGVRGTHDNIGWALVGLAIALRWQRGWGRTWFGDTARPGQPTRLLLTCALTVTTLVIGCVAVGVPAQGVERTGLLGLAVAGLSSFFVVCRRDMQEAREVAIQFAMIERMLGGDPEWVATRGQRFRRGATRVGAGAIGGWRSGSWKHGGGDSLSGDAAVAGGILVALAILPVWLVLHVIGSNVFMTGGAPVAIVILAWVVPGMLERAVFAPRRERADHGPAVSTASTASTSSESTAGSVRSVDSTPAPLTVGAAGRSPMQDVLDLCETPQQAMKWLRSQGVPTGRAGVTVGRLTNPQTGAVEVVRAFPHLLGVGKSGQGKTSSVLAQNIIGWEGKVFGTSSKGDLACMTGAWRARLSGGEAWFFDPTGKSVPPEHTKALRWSPLAGVHSADDAIYSANQLVLSAAKDHQGSAGAHFTAQAQRVLAPLLYAAALKDRRMSTLLAWLRRTPEQWMDGEDGDAEGPIAVLRDLDDPTMVETLAGFVAQAAGHGGREANSVLTTLQNFFLPYMSSASRRDADEPNFDPREFVRSTNDFATVYIATSAGSEAEAWGPFVALLVNQVLEHRRNWYPIEGGVPLLVAADEASSLPIAGLGAAVSNDRAYDITICAMLQSDTQIHESHIYKKSLLETFGNKIIFPKSGSPEMHETIEQETGKTHRWLASVGESQAQKGAEHMLRLASGGIHATQAGSQSEGMTQHEVPILPRADVVGALERGQVRFLDGWAAHVVEVEQTAPDGRPEIGKVAPVVDLWGPVDRPGPFYDLNEWARDRFEHDRQVVEAAAVAEAEAVIEAAAQAGVEASSSGADEEGVGLDD